MRKVTLIAACAAVVAAVPAYAQDKADMGKEWCTDAHMKDMDAKVAAIADADKKKTVKEHLDLSKAAFKKGDTAGCVKHMEEAHKAMG